MQIKDLKPNPKNPRKISTDQLEMLKASVEEFGDLSGFVFNRRSKKLISGHQKQKIVPPKSRIVLEAQYEKPTKCRTIAEGYVLIGEERFKYREVDADLEWESAAMLAANKHSGDWDKDLLRVVLSEVQDVYLTGFTPIELKTYGVHLPEIKSPFADAIEEPETDEEYVRNTPETQERIDREQIPSRVNEEDPSRSAFDSIEEETTVKGKRFVVIVDCKDQESKDRLKEKLRPLVEEEAGAKIF